MLETKKCIKLNFKNPLAQQHIELHTYVLDAVGSWQIILSMPNLERPY